MQQLRVSKDCARDGTLYVKQVGDRSLAAAKRTTGRFDFGKLAETSFHLAVRSFAHSRFRIGRILALVFVSSCDAYDSVHGFIMRTGPWKTWVAMSP